MSEVQKPPPVAPAPAEPDGQAMARPLVLSATIAPANSKLPPAAPFIRIELGNLTPGCRAEVLKIKHDFRPQFGSAAAISLELSEVDPKEKRGLAALTREQAAAAGLTLGDRMMLRLVSAEGKASYPVEFALALGERESPVGSARFLQRQKELPGLDERETPRPRSGQSARPSSGQSPRLQGGKLPADQLAPREGEGKAPKVVLDPKPKSAGAAPSGQSLGDGKDGVVDWK
ncbi:MAG: hypothetical protein HYZ28_26225 [Myxococcales bacterium]|nr:hypothetical protein [Myxococcales bacterium]